MMAVHYFYGDFGDESPYFTYGPWLRGWVICNPSECCMLIPVSFAEMKDL